MVLNFELSSFILLLKKACGIHFDPNDPSFPSAIHAKAKKSEAHPPVLPEIKPDPSNSYISGKIFSNVWEELDGALVLLSKEVKVSTLKGKVPEITEYDSLCFMRRNEELKEKGYTLLKSEDATIIKPVFAEDDMTIKKASSILTKCHGKGFSPRKVASHFSVFNKAISLQDFQEKENPSLVGEGH